MRKAAATIILPVLAVALLAALAALWPSGALAGPPHQAAGQARINGLAFAAFPRSSDYTAGENIRVTVKFDRNVTVSGKPQLDINVGGQKRWATYYHGSGSPNLKFAYQVQATDWDDNGVSVASGSLALNGGSITSGSNIAASLTHSGISDDASRKVKGSADTTPSFGSGPVGTLAYDKGRAITARTFPAATGGNGLLTYGLSPTPPNGLVFNPATRTLSGTPTTTQNGVFYLYTAKDANGDTATLRFVISVDGAPSFPGSGAGGAQTFAKGQAIAGITLPPAGDGNTPLTYSITPALPDGLVFDAATRVLSGTPTTTQNAAAYTYTVTDADGDTDSRTITITVDGAPSFPADAVGAQTYAKGTAITRLGLPAATDGNTPLTYSLTPALPDGLVLDPVTRAITGTPTTTQNAVTYTYTVTDADGDTATQSFTIAVTGDYDLDDDGLIDVDSLVKLNAIRWDLNGDGSVDTGTSVADTAKYRAAFAGAVAGMGCLRDHDDNTATPKVAGCIGYELTQDLDFDTDGDGATYTTSSAGVVTGDADDEYDNGGKGWKPIGGPVTPSSASPLNIDLARQFTAIFDGNGKTVANLFIKDTGANSAGLFGVVGPGGRIERLSVSDVNVTGNDFVGGLVGLNNGGAINAAYATGSVTGPPAGSATRSADEGVYAVGGLVGRNNHPGVISASYAIGSVTGSYYSIGGLVGHNGGTIKASYATGSVTGGSAVGSLVGWNYPRGTISASYATGSVTGGSAVGSLVGHSDGAISASYATGYATGSGGGGLVGSPYHTSTVTNSYWDTETTGQATSKGGIGKTTRELQSPTGYSGIYAAWNLNLDGVAGNDDPWDFGANDQYPALKYGGLVPALQRVTVSVQSVNGNIPIVGGPVTAIVNATGVAGTAWQWQSSADGFAWANIANATGATYFPVAADAAGGGKRLRVRVSFTASGKSLTLTTDRTAKVVSNANAPVTAATSAPIVGEKLRYYLSADGATHRTAWQWQRCDDAAMTGNCVLRAQTNSASDAHTEYTPAAGEDSDVGKYLQAYAYYADNDAGKTWTRTESPVLGPVVAAPAAAPSASP